MNDRTRSKSNSEVDTMKIIAQFLLTLALSLAATAGLNTNVRGKIQQTFDRVETTVAQATDFAAQTVSRVTANAETHASTNANIGASVGSRSSASASTDANGSANLSTMLKGIFSNGQTNAGASATAQGSTDTSSDGSLLNLIFGGRGSASGGLEIGK
jgi:hypothetical protein